MRQIPEGHVSHSKNKKQKYWISFCPIWCSIAPAKASTLSTKTTTSCMEFQQITIPHVIFPLSLSLSLSLYWYTKTERAIKGEEKQYQSSMSKVCLGLEKKFQKLTSRSEFQSQVCACLPHHIASSCRIYFKVGVVLNSSLGSVFRQKNILSKARAVS